MRLPSCCPLCQQLHRSPFAVCTRCHDALPRLLNPCLQCAYPLLSQEKGLCGQCIKQPPAFDVVHSAYVYTPFIGHLIRQYKYQEALYLRTFLAQLLLEAIPSTPRAIDAIVPMPLHVERLKSRGFNPSLELAKRVSQHMNIPLRTDICWKHEHTAAQASLPAKARTKNLIHSFSSTPCEGMRIAVIDDLLTTGSTAHALASVLKRHGAHRIEVWCCARTPLT